MALITSRPRTRRLQYLHKGTRVKTSIVNDSLSSEETHELFRAALSFGRAHRRGTRVVCALPRRTPQTSDSLAEGSGFELSVPLSNSRTTTFRRRLKRSRRRKIKRGRIATGDRHLSGTCGLNRTGRQVEDRISHPSRAFMGPEGMP